MIRLYNIFSNHIFSCTIFSLRISFHYQNGFSLYSGENTIISPAIHIETYPGKWTFVIFKKKRNRRKRNMLYGSPTTARCCVSFVSSNSTLWASCQIRKLAGAHAPGMPGTFSPSPQASDPDMHHGTCVTHVPWCMPGSLTSGFFWNRRRGKTFPAFPAHAQPAILRIW